MVLVRSAWLNGATDATVAARFVSRQLSKSGVFERERLTLIPRICLLNEAPHRFLRSIVLTAPKRHTPVCLLERTLCKSPQSIEQSLRFLQIVRFKALGIPGKYWREQFERFLALALVDP